MKYKVVLTQEQSDPHPLDDPNKIEMNLYARDAINAVNLAKAELDTPDRWTAIEVVRIRE